MNGSDVILRAVGFVLLLAAIPTVALMVREVLQRLATKRAITQLAEARTVFASLSAESRADTIAAALSPRFEPATLERVVESALRDGDATAKRRAVEMGEALGLVVRVSKRLREARGWNDRAHSAELLGLLGSSVGVPALVECLRDPYEDDATVKRAAATALARIREPAVIPLLVSELHTIDDWSSPRVADALVAFGSAATGALVQLLADTEHARGAVWAARVLGRSRDPESVEPLIGRLQDPNDELRIAASEALGAIGDRRSVQPLIQAALRDPVAQVRAHAAGALGKVGDASTSGVLIGMLADPDFGTRLRVLEALEMVHPEDTSALEGALRDPNLEVRRRAALAIERVGYLERKVTELDSTDADVARKAYTAVLELGRAGLADSLAGYLHHKSPRVRAEMARACGELGVARVAPLLVAAIDDTAALVRASLAEAIGRLRAEGGAAALARLLDDADATVRERAAEALAAFDRDDLKPFVASMVAAFDRGTAATRGWLTQILGRLDLPAAQGLLLRAVIDPDAEVRLRAVQGLAGVAGDDALRVLKAAIFDAATEVRHAAVDGLGVRDDVDAAEAVLRALPGAAPEMREHLARALSRGGWAVFDARIEPLLDSEDLDVRLGLAWALGKLADPRGIQHLARYLRDPDAKLRASAAGALGKITAPQSVAALRVACRDPDPRTRAAVVNALGRVATAQDDACSALAAMLDDPDAFVRHRVVIALGRLPDGGGAAVLATPWARRRVPSAVGLVARALAGMPEAIVEASEALGDPAQSAEIQSLLEGEDEGVRAMFFARLHLELPTGPLAEALDRPAIVARYQQLLRTSQDLRSRRVAVETLARYRTEQCIETLADVVTGDPSEEIRLLAAQALAQSGAVDLAMTALARATTDPSSGVAIVAVRALGRSRVRAHGEVLFRALGSSNADVKQAAIEAIAELYRSDPMPLIDQMMGAARSDVVTSCVFVLARWGEPSLLPLLLELLKSREQSIRAATVWALAALPLPEATAAVDEARRDAMESVRTAALEAIASWNPDHATERLEVMRTDNSTSVRARLAMVLGAVEAASAMDLLAALATDGDAEVSATAMVSLLSRHDGEGLGAFEVALRNSTPEVQRALRSDARAGVVSEALADHMTSARSEQSRRAAVLGIAALAVPEFERSLIPALGDPAPRVRLAAVHALEALHRPSVLEALARLEKDPDAKVRLALQRARSGRGA